MTGREKNGDGDAIPGWLRENLPKKLDGMELVGTDVAGVTDSARLYGPPGAGKTTQITVRTAVVADALDLHPSDITVCTFRTSQADKVRERGVDWDAFPEGDADTYEYWATTHAVAARATGFHDQFDGESDDLEGMANEKQKRRFCDEYDVTFQVPKPWYSTAWDVFHNLYTYAKQNMLDVGSSRFLDGDRWDRRPLEQDMRAWRKLDAFHDEWESGTSFHAVAEAWETWKHRHNVYDFFEQLEAALAADAPLPLMELLVIDEYHDAYPLMATLSEKWIRNAEIALVAGDPDQCINSFNGADPRIFERLHERVDKDMPVIHLPKSHRCPTEHYQAAARMLREERNVPALDTDGRGLINRFRPTPIDYDDRAGEWDLPNPDEPGTPVWLWCEHGPGVMFLARTQRQLDGVGAALDRHGIVYESQTDVAGDWEKRLRLMRALDRVADVRPATQASVLDGDQYDDSGRQHERIGRKRFTPDEAFALVEHSDARALDGQGELLSLIGTARLQNNSVHVDEFAQHVKDSWWGRYANGRESIDELTYLNDDEKTAMKMAWTRYEDRKFTIDVADDTRLLTIHAAKGAEQDDVVLYDGTTKRIQDQCDEHDDERENEARTWYVSLTRASERLHIVRDGHEWTRQHLPDDLEPAAAAAAKRAADRDADGSTGGEQA
ncbi:UvrD-helicase domain-containing protein [Natrinema versiforme]|uniref:DNA 3'-5' helicase n=1 Tax=Natrinema versiforme TaxID=88724 RepID=A0A4P8WJI6_9EURY|nr:UvrD-helicase domain-containing protein [Natrinema versiforme]QCS43647.1 ATP-dependent helicase [Natrinema versiforme]